MDRRFAFVIATIALLSVSGTFAAAASNANVRYFSLSLDFSLDGSPYSLTESWTCKRGHSPLAVVGHSQPWKQSATEGWSTSAQFVVRQISPQRAVFVRPPGECDIEDGDTYITWLGLFPEVSDPHTFYFYPGGNSNDFAESGDSGVVKQAVVHELSGPGPEHAPTALEARLKTQLDLHQWDYKSVVGGVLFEPEWRAKLQASVIGVLERSTVVATSWEVSSAPYFLAKPLNLQPIAPVAPQLHQSVRVFNTVYSDGAWIAGNPEIFVRFTDTPMLPALVGRPVGPVVVEYKGKRGRLQGLATEFFDPQDRTVIVFEIDHADFQNMMATYKIHVVTPHQVVPADPCSSSPGCVRPIPAPELDSTSR